MSPDLQVDQPEEIHGGQLVTRAARVLRVSMDGRPPWWTHHIRSPHRGRRPRRVRAADAAETLLASVEQDVSELGRECLVNDAWEIFETEPRELGSALAEVHLRLCQVHDPVPLELAAWLAKLVGDADGETYLDVPEGYADVLGVEGLAEFEALLDGASR
jgi:hypothetical protein